MYSACHGIYAQNDVILDSSYLVEMKDGNVFIGKLKVLETEKLYELKTNLGVLTLRQEEVKYMRKIQKEDIHKGSYWPANPHSSRYFFSPSGYGLRKGEGYYQNAWIFLNQVSYGLSNNFSIGFGLIPTFIFGTAEIIPLWLTPKFSFPYKNQKGAFGIGTIFFAGLGLESSEDNFGIVYATNTFGSRDKQLTLGLGLGYSRTGGFSNYPAFNLGGLVRTGKKWAFVTENYLFSTGYESLGIISAGGRYMGKRLAIDMGGFIPIATDQDFYAMLPWLSISVPFGKHY